MPTKKRSNISWRTRSATRAYKRRRAKKMDLKSLMQLVPRDSVGFSMPSDKRGSFGYKCNDNSFTYLNSTLTENYQKTQTETGKPDKINSEFDASNDEVMIDLIKTEVDILLEDPITVNKDDFIKNMEEDECAEIDEFKEETIDEDDSNKEEHLDDDDDNIEYKEEYLCDDDDDDDDNIEYKEEYLSDDDGGNIEYKEEYLSDDDDDDNIEYKEEYILDNENPLSENMNIDNPLHRYFDNEKLLKPIKEVSFKTHLNGIMTETIKSKVTNSKKVTQIKNKNTMKQLELLPFKTYLNGIKTETIKSKVTTSKKVTQTKNKNKNTMKQLELLHREPFDLNDFSLDELKCIKRSLSASDKKYVNLRLKIEGFKNSVVDLLEQGKIDLGEVKITKEVFLEMVAKCSINGFKVLGITKQGLPIPKVKKFLLSLHKRFNPDYETVFKIEYLNTKEKKLAEFESRKHSEEYIKAAFKCQICFLPFSLKSKLDYHNNWHDPDRAHACDICPMRFTKRRPMKVHRRTHNTVYRCKLCPVVTYYSDGMFNHYHQHKGKLYTCDICLGQYESKSTLYGHRLTHARFTCELCGRKFNSQQTLDKHREIKHANDKAGADEATLSCDICDAVFKTDLQHRRHMRKHESLFYKCLFTSCNKRFSSASELQEHARSSGHVRRPTNGETCKKEAKKSFKICPVCGVEVADNSPTSLYRHYQRHHPFEPYHCDSGSAYPMLCEHCGKSFMNKTVYQDHLNTHTGAKPHECEECGARFSKRRLLHLHSERHGAPRHQCEDCGKKFKSFANLYNHRRTHIGDRKFKCTVCDKGFLHSGSLNEHIRGVHNGIRRDKRRVRKQTDK